jgi:hypothetical protein
MTGASRTDLTRLCPAMVKECCEKEQMTEQTAAFKTDAILENKEETVSQDIMLIVAPFLGTRNANIRQNSATKGREATDGGASRSKSFKK